MLPIVGTLLANALPLLANAVVAKGTSYVKEQTGIDLSAGIPSQEQLVQLKQYEMEHEEELLRLRLEENKLDVELEKLRFADLDSARKREMEIGNSANASSLQKNVGPILAIGTVLLTFLMFWYFAWGSLDPNSPKKDIIVYILGVLSTITTQIFSYYFGSSQGSSAKNDTVERLIRQQEGAKK